MTHDIFCFVELISGDVVRWDLSGPGKPRWEYFGSHEGGGINMHLRVVFSISCGPSRDTFITTSMDRKVCTQGGTHIFAGMGMCRSNGSLFYKKSLNIVPVFYQKILKHGSTFLTEPKFSGFCVAKTPKIMIFFF